MESFFENINHILADWNPIGVPDEIAKDEYVGYIPSIIKSITNKQRLFSCLENILINDIGIVFDSNNQEHVKDLQQVCDKITQAYKMYYPLIS